MGFRSIPRTFAYALLLIVLLIFIVSTQSGVEAESGDYSGSKEPNRRSKIGDETFIIAALIAMRHPRSIGYNDDAWPCFKFFIYFLGCVYFTLLGDQIQNRPRRKKWKNQYIQVEEKFESGQGKTTFRRFFSRFCAPIFLESFILTFLAAWGDRIQIATIALATNKNALTLEVATVGGLLFLCFSISSYFYPPL